MPSPFGSTVQAPQAAPVVGGQAQQNFIQALQQQVMPNNQIQGVAPYSGQLTPDLSKSLSNQVWNSWSPQAPGMTQGTQAMQNLMAQGQQIQGMSNMYNMPGGGYIPSRPQMPPQSNQPFHPTFPGLPPGQSSPPPWLGATSPWAAVMNQPGGAR